MKVKRILAYATDLIILSFISTLIYSIVFKNTAYKEYEEKVDSYIKEIKESGSTEYTEDDLVEILYEINKTQIPKLIIDFGLAISYFGIISYMTNGKTIGKKIFNLRVVPIEGKNLKPSLYFLREIVLTNSIFNLLSIINISLCNLSKWYHFNVIITNSKTIISLILILTLIFREDERSLHDLIFKTKVIEETTTEEKE